ncbi:MAG: GGDEF domain-containing protein, partial [Gammaproteobacteria bacterium]|nr:GGDEF domain-containing protein [Gammaproteobacteria bacterium]
MMLRQLTAKSYLLALSLFGLLLFALFGFNLLLRGDAVEEIILQEKQQAAKAELRRAVTTVIDDAQQILEELAQWDEIHQQLGDPTHYVYWREMRLHKSQQFPAYLRGMELYSRERKVLVELPYQSFPATLPGRRLTLTSREGREYLVAYGPIPDRNGGADVSGYLGIQIDFAQAIRQLNRFVEIDPKSLDLRFVRDGPVDVGSLVSNIDYALVEEPTASRLGSILVSSLRDFFLLFATMLVVFYFTVSLLFVRPLAQLERYIDRLRHGGREGPVLSVKSLPAVAELVTVRDSLDEYQRELDMARTRLDDQNIELWDLAHEDSLTGVKNRLAFDEDWKELIALARDKRIDISLMLLDCDFFKAINDTYGH